MEERQMDMEHAQESGQALAVVLIVAALFIIGWGIFAVAFSHPSHTRPSVTNVGQEPLGVFPPPDSVG